MVTIPDIDTQKNRITALIDSVVNGTEYVEPTATEIDTTVPTITILANQSKGMVFGQGLATTGYIWDGTLNFEEYLSEMTFSNPQALTMGNIVEDLKMSTQIPIGNNFTETLGSLKFEDADTMTIGTIIDNIVMTSRQVSTTITVDTTGEYNSYFVDTSEGKFKPRTTYKFVSVEVDSDTGLRAELSVDTTGITVSSLEVVKE